MQKAMSALPPKADSCSAQEHVCFGPIVDIGAHLIFASLDYRFRQRLVARNQFLPSLVSRLLVDWCFGHDLIHKSGKVGAVTMAGQLPHRSYARECKNLFFHYDLEPPVSSFMD